MDEFGKWLASTAERCVLVEFDVNVDGVERTLFTSTRYFASASSDSPPLTQYLPIVAGGVKIDRSVSTSGDVTLSYGDIEIDNASGEVDAWMSYVFEGRQVRVFYGDASKTKAEFTQVFTGVAIAVDSRKADRINIKIGDYLQKLNSSVSATAITVSSGDEKICPLVFGEVFNITPLLLDSAQLIYKVHADRIERIIEVRDNGVPVQFSPLKASGSFQLLSAPVGEVTCSIQGDAVGGYTNTVGGVVERLVLRFASSLAEISSSPFNAAKLAQFKVDNPQPIGVYITDKTNLLALCCQLAKSVGYTLTVGADGLLFFINFTTFSSPVATIGVDDVVARGISPAKIIPPTPVVKVGWNKNWTPQTSGLSSGIPAAHATLFAEEWLTIQRKNLASVTLYKYSAEPALLETFLLTHEDALTLAESILERDGVRRVTYSVAGALHLMTLELGDDVRLLYPRFNLDAGRVGKVVAISLDLSKNSVSLDVFT